MRTLLDPLLRFNSLVGSTVQCERSNAPVAQFCQSIGCSPMFSPRGVVQRDLWARRTGSPSYSAYDGLPVRRPRRSKRKLAAKPQVTAFLRVQTSDSTKDSIDIKLPEAGERLEAIGVRKQTLTTHHLPLTPCAALRTKSKQPDHLQDPLPSGISTRNPLRAGSEAHTTFAVGYSDARTLRLLVCFAVGSKPGGLVHPLPGSKASVAGAK